MAGLLWRKNRRILIDVDTQYDCFQGNERDHATLLRQIRRLIAWARVHHLMVISTALTRRADNGVESYDMPAGCIEGTAGQKKIHYTTLPSSIVFGPENRLDLPKHLLGDYQQIIFEKRTEDPFTHPRADRLLSELKADELIVFGMGTEKAVKSTVLGLLCRRKRVVVVTDALDSRDERAGAQALRQMEAKGAKLITTDELTGQSRLTGRIAPQPRWSPPILHPARTS